MPDRRDGRPATPAAITAIDIAICTPPPGLNPGRTRRDRSTPRTPRPPQPPARRHGVLAIMNTGQRRAWSGKELAAQLQVKPGNLLTQLAEWARLGFLTHAGYGTYALNTPSPETPWTNAPDP